MCDIRRAKYILILFLILLCFSSVPVSAQISLPTQIAYVSSKEGLAVLRVTVSDRNGKEKLRQKLLLEAVKTLLFKGIPASPLSEPLIVMQQDDSEKKFKSFFSKFYDKGFMSFIVNEELDNKPIYENRYYSLTGTISVNREALRKYLVSNNIIAGYGF